MWYVYWNPNLTRYSGELFPVVSNLLFSIFLLFCFLWEYSVNICSFKYVYMNSCTFFPLKLRLSSILKESNQYNSIEKFPQNSVTTFLVSLLCNVFSVHFSSFTQSCPTICDHMDCHTSLPVPSPTHGVYSNSCPLSWWCHPIISSSVVPFSSGLQSFPASRSFQMNQFFTSSGQSIGISASA